MELQRFSRLFARESNLTIIILLAVAILAAPYLLKENESPLGKEGYYNLIIAKDILKEKSLINDEKYSDMSFPALIALISFIFRMSLETAMNVLLFLLGIASVILFYNILKRYNFYIGFISCLILIFSPAFIYLFIEGGEYAVPFFLSLLLTYFILKERYITAGVTFIFMPLFNLESAILIGLMLICYILYLKRKRLLLIILILLMLILSFVYYNGFNLNIISDFGSKIGVSIFAVFLFFFGFSVSWEKKKFLLLHGIAFLLFLFSIKFIFVLFYLNLLLSILVSVSLIELFDRKWENILIKNLTLLLLICGLLFSGVSYAKNISEDSPSNEFFIALEKVPDDAIIFSSLDNKYWINYAGKEMAFDNELNDYNDILMLRDAEISRFLLDKYNINYILIDNKMRKKIWENQMDGLLWVLNYDIEHFNNIYDGEEVDVWRYTRI